MLKHLILFLLFLGISCHVNGLPRDSVITANLANVILKSSYSMGDDPIRTANCFKLYSPKLIQVTQDYQESYNECLNQTTHSEDNLNHELQGDIATIRKTSETMRSHFDNCSIISNSLYDIFDCYNNAAGSTIQTASNVKGLAKNKMKYVKITEEFISYNQTVCTDKCFAIYNKESMKIHSDLENCLAGGSYVVSTSTVEPETSQSVETTESPHAATTDKTETTYISPTTNIPTTGQTDDSTKGTVESVTGTTLSN